MDTVGQPLLKRFVHREYLTGNRLLDDGLVHPLDETVFGWRSFLDETNNDSQGNEPQMERSRIRRSRSIVIEHAVVVQTDPLRQTILGESAT